MHLLDLKVGENNSFNSKPKVAIKLPNKNFVLKQGWETSRINSRQQKIYMMRSHSLLRLATCNEEEEEFVLHF